MYKRIQYGRERKIWDNTGNANALIATNIEKVYSVKILVNENTTISELTKKAIDTFNQEKIELVDKAGKPLGYLEFKGDVEKYHIKPAKKKTGMPKNDYPPFLPTSKISDAQRSHFALIFPPHEAVNVLPLSGNKDNCKVGCGIY